MTESSDIRVANILRLGCMLTLRVAVLIKLTELPRLHRELSKRDKGYGVK